MYFPLQLNNDRENESFDHDDGPALRGHANPGR